MMNKLKVYNFAKKTVIYISVFHFLSVLVNRGFLGAVKQFHSLSTSSLPHKGIRDWTQELMNPIQKILNKTQVYPATDDEQFTVIIMTYKRLEMLNRTLLHLNGLKSINKTIIVWNDINVEPPDFETWINVSYPIQVLVPTKNSLNNRFFIYEDAQTEAILSLDDDVIISHDVINFSFRAWQSDRQIIVGSISRAHKWDEKKKKWRYSYGEKCSTSMVLLGGAFYHKRYNYAYREEMPKIVLSVVDTLFNCEDIAMNFLVSHITKRPPFKVGNPIPSFCRKCKSNLSGKKNHIITRDKCLNYFANIYDYMPLKYSYQPAIPNSHIKNCPVEKLPYYK